LHAPPPREEEDGKAGCWSVLPASIRREKREIEHAVLKSPHGTISSPKRRKKKKQGDIGKRQLYYVHTWPGRGGEKEAGGWGHVIFHRASHGAAHEKKKKEEKGGAVTLLRLSLRRP